jgi:hypothetical protein
VWSLRLALGLALGLSAPLACGGDDEGEVLASATIGPEGGTLSHGDITLEVPAGALTAPTEIELRKIRGDLSARDFEQQGDAMQFTVVGGGEANATLRLPAELRVGGAAEETAILFEQDGMTVAAVGATAYLNELGRFAKSSAGTVTVTLTAPEVASSPAATPAPNTDVARLRLELTDVARLQLAVTAYDVAGAYDKPLNGTQTGSCAFNVLSVTGGSLTSGCTEGALSGSIGVSSAAVEFDLVPFLAGKIETPVAVGIVAGGEDLAFQLGFIAFNTGSCFNETCSGHGTCNPGAPASCSCDEGWRPEGLECICVPQCDGRQCGSDSCGGQCQPGCAQGETCDFGTGQCNPDGSGTTGSTTDPSGGTTGTTDPSTGTTGTTDPSTGTTGTTDPSTGTTGTTDASTGTTDPSTGTTDATTGSTGTTDPTGSTSDPTATT